MSDDEDKIAAWVLVLLVLLGGGLLALGILTQAYQ